VSVTARRRLARYKRLKDTARTPRQFLRWSLRFHNLCGRLYGPPNLWRAQ
jgi:hypothetical protein